MTEAQASATHTDAPAMPQTTAQTTTQDLSLDIPEGFKARHMGEGFIGVNGPLYTRRTDTGLQMGFRVEMRHTNPMKICHGGMMATFCDMLCPITAHRVSKEVGMRFLPTISLHVDYLGPAPLGAWVQGEAQVLKVTRTMVFMQGLVTADGVNVARVSGVFKLGKPFDSFLKAPES